jgi:cobalt-zinc-cadmium efflux system outer membrane protein
MRPASLARDLEYLTSGNAPAECRLDRWLRLPGAFIRNRDSSQVRNAAYRFPPEFPSFQITHSMVFGLPYFPQIRRVAAPAIVALFTSCSLKAAEPQAVPPTIDGLVTQALARNPELRHYKAEIVIAKAGRKPAGKLPNPELDLDIGRKRITSGDAKAEGIAYSVTLAQPIEWPGRIGLRKAIADRDIALAEIGLERFRAYLAARVKLLGYALATQQENAAAAAEVADRFTAVKEVIVQREPGGVAPLLEAKIIEAAEIGIQRKAGEAAIEMQQALLELNQLMGRRADTPLQVKRMEFPLPQRVELVSLLNEAARHNYDLLIRAAEFEKQGLQVSLAKNERYPTFTVGPSISHERAGEKETVIGLSLSVPLPLWDDGKSAVDASIARRMQAEASLQTTMREVERQLTGAWLLLETHRKRLNSSNPELQKSFAEAAQLADRHYRSGAVPLSTYIEMQEKYLEAIEAINATRLDLLKAALELEQLVGTPAILSSTK